MTVGELAKKMEVTVRTIQYYDRMEILKPSAESEGGFRLYTDKELMKLQQILSLKYLGFSLSDIKNCIISLDSPADVVDVLTQQADIIKERIASMTEALQAIEKLKNETLQIETVDFRRYAEIIVRLRNGGKDYWAIKKFNDKILDHVRTNFGDESENITINAWEQLCDEAEKLQQSKIQPASEQGKAFGKKYWDMMSEFICGDMSLLSDLVRFGQNRDGWVSELKEKYERARDFINLSMDEYLNDQDYHPFRGIPEYDSDLKRIRNQ